MRQRRELSVRTSQKVEFIDITGRIEDAVKGIDSGVVHVFCPHTTAGLTINENADPAVVRDMIRGLEKMVPDQGGYTHAEGNSPAHIKASIMGFYQAIIIEKGSLLLGTWQGIYFCEFDGPRHRKLFITMTA